MLKQSIFATATSMQSYPPYTWPLQKFLRLHANVTLNENQSHSKWYQTVESNGNYHYTDFQKNQFINILAPANISVFFWWNHWSEVVSLTKCPLPLTAIGFNKWKCLNYKPIFMWMDENHKKEWSQMIGFPLTEQPLPRSWPLKVIQNFTGQWYQNTRKVWKKNWKTCA